MRQAHNLTRPVLVGLVTLIAGAAGSAELVAAEHQATISRQFAAREGLIVELENLAGEISISGSGGDQIAVEATIIARNGSQSAAEELASKLTVDFDERGQRLLVTAVYPVAEHSRYHYPGASEAGGFWIFGSHSHTNARYQGRQVHVYSEPRGGAVTLFANFTVRLPHGVGAKVRNVAGPLDADGVHGPLSLDAGSGRVRARSGEGPVDVDTGSGEVEVRNYHGRLDVDTGSGDVRIEAVVGDVKADTGSGDVEVDDVEGSVDVDTGSGEVELSRVRGSVRADTGSGEVEGRNLRVTGQLRVSTGSGGVSLEGDFSEVDGMAIETGSGGVTIDAAGLAPMDLRIDTGSGGISVDLPEMEVLRQERDSLRARVRGGGTEVVIETGSGGVRIRHSG